MPLIIQTATTPLGPPILDNPAEIQRLAIEQGSLVPDGSTVVGITLPILRFDLTALQFQTRNNGSEFQFNTGTLRLTLRQEIHISRALSPCARTIWLQHEQKHVRDNERLMTQLDQELRADREFADLLVHPTEWHPRANFHAVQQLIEERIHEVFRWMTSDAAEDEDSRFEYQRVDRQIRLRCGHTVGPLLKRDMFGDGIDIVQNALNTHGRSALPPLNVDGIYGSRTEARVREFQRNNALNPDGVVGHDTRGKLGL